MLFIYLYAQFSLQIAVNAVLTVALKKDPQVQAALEFVQFKLGVNTYG